MSERITRLEALTSEGVTNLDATDITVAIDVLLTATDEVIGNITVSQKNKLQRCIIS